ncbi:MAG TPA: recombinase family protein [Sphaerochaeta sp.]|nr:recombinase family protein [Sphaerochaeta sp.]
MEGQTLQATNRIPDGVRMLCRENARPQVRKTRVAAYCRVSTELEQQKSSLATQMEAFNDMIGRHDDWVLAGIYTDEETGTSRRNRDGFNALMADAENGKIDIILVKSVQRFARNTVDALTATRRLKALGVSVFFERDNINTSQATSELYLTLMAAVAQEESHSLSENMKWGIRKRFAAGIPKWSATFGYRKAEDGNWVIEESEAVHVRRIFEMYKHGSGLPAIVSALEQDGVITQMGGTKWYPHTITTMLKNEKYIGDVRMQKGYTADHLSHRRVSNRDLLVPQYYIHDHHRPIIDRESFAVVQKIAVLCDPHRGSTQYPYYGLLRCPHCGLLMIRFQYPGHFSKEKGWTCGGAKGYEKRGERTSCKPLSISEGYIHNAFWQAFDDLDEEELLTIRKGEGKEARGASFALEAKQRIREELSGKQHEPSYYLLVRTVESLSFSEDYHDLVVTWTMGMTSRVAIAYRKPWHRPTSVLTFEEGRYRIDGKLIGSGKQVAACLGSRPVYINSIRIVDAAEEDGMQIPNVYPPLSKCANSNGEVPCELQG